MACQLEHSCLNQENVRVFPVPKRVVRFVLVMINGFCVAPCYRKVLASCTVGFY